MNYLNGKKTYIVSAVTFLYAVVVVGWQQGSWQQALDFVLAAAGAGSLRHAIAKN